MNTIQPENDEIIRTKILERGRQAGIRPDSSRALQQWKEIEDAVRTELNLKLKNI